jgi:hypothetical protein
MTTLTMRVVRGDFIVTGPDIEPMKFRAEARRETGAGRIIPARRSPRSVPAASARHPPRNRQSDRAGVRSKRGRVQTSRPPPRDHRIGA